MRERCECMRNACRAALYFFYVITYFFSFLKLGSAILVHHGRLPYPRLKLFLFPLTSFRLLIFMYYFKDDLKKALRVCTV